MPRQKSVYDLRKIFKVGDKIIWITDNMLEGYYEYKGTVKEVHEDHILTDIPELNDHCWFDERDLDSLKIAN